MKRGIRQYAGVVRDQTTAFSKMKGDRAARFQPLYSEMFPPQREHKNPLLDSDYARSDVNLKEDTERKLPNWIRLYEECKLMMEEISEKMGELGRMQTQRCLPKFNDQDKDLDAKIAEYMRDISLSLRSCEANINSIGRLEEGEGCYEQSIRENVQRVLASRLQEITRELRRLEKEYFLKRKEMLGEDYVSPSKNAKNPNTGRIFKRHRSNGAGRVGTRS